MRDSVRAVATWACVCVCLGSLSVACAPAVVPPTPTPAEDAFAVVRATSQAAFTSGRAALDRGDFLQACVDLDTAKTTDPDNRSEIDQALQQALLRCLTPVAAAASAIATPQPLPTIVVPIAPVAASAAATPAVATSPGAAGSPGATGGGSLGAAEAMATWNDPQGRFTVAAPTSWTRLDQAQGWVGTGVVGFRDPTSRAEFAVSVVTDAAVVSPELYAARLERAMQEQVRGYAAEQALPGSTAGNPSLKRVFTFSQRDPSNQEHQARAVQITVVKGSTPYVLSGWAPAPEFLLFSSTFDRIVESFRFS